ncbi:MAG: hypothetical protein IGS49_16100 [Chlorogloeopsis fritschii C42_A2020_084]|uniref:hypothetical protein n=1 Tax=Chlorogloeopsis fritschii TaxID=1124 RepID=UPI0019DEA0BB|nr:hypothetical protein [Chlorogloeopsis fritschii]MBF2006944.1 hypothetical protein [Chlorogloeopsis fritschii C42_A2020_084]
MLNPVEYSFVAESRDLDSAARSEIEDALELLWEQVETLKQELYYKELDLQEIEQELNYINQELCAALTSEWPPLDEAKQLFKNILVSKKPISESLAELLSLIYNSTVQASELGQIDICNTVTISTSALDNPLPTGFAALKTKNTVLREQAAEIRAKSRMLRKQAYQIQARHRELKAEFNELGVHLIGLRASYLSRQTNFSQSQPLSNSSELSLR